MQSQETPTPTSQPSNPYDFILKDQQKPKKSLHIPSFGLPKPVFMILTGTVLLFLIIIIASAIFGGKGSPGGMAAVLGRAQEIVRVSKVVEPLAQNPDTQGLVATTEAAFTSQQNQISAYLKKANVKIDTKTLSLYTDKNSDTQMQTAAQNNNLDGAYAAYLKKSLTDYQNSLQAAAKSTSKTRLQILNNAFQSTKTLLAAPQVTNISS